MGPTEIGGLPAHILIVHVVIVMVPLAALLTVLSAAWPAARRKLGILTLIAALAALISVPLATHAGEWLKARVGATPLVERHADLADGLLPWVIGLFVVAAGQWAYHRFYANAPAASRRGAGTAITVTIAALAVIASVGAVVEVYRIGESGSKAVWTGSFSADPKSGS
ncbi:hypothetical protein SAMN05892883_0353 [Jatrophihabitans sp. GAS493]|uniref:DUF2231 domain-containing protein n=1 Tax=Jatrophihabitans sp. GAS493 TaxID=1907575 RepID=UPI000BBF45C8|nr:DUF2231 domain-containing protein [Jatrophihabitans sp. GAS493]SOD70693.1 hypothetical protein SAMN05892883_0353 [Jatrophihabitans sp. GAS493]